jgi:uncharacterized protein YaaN involved in tellurite resistance
MTDSLVKTTNTEAVNDDQAAVKEVIASELATEVEKYMELSTRDQERIDEIVADIDIIDPSMSLSYGTKTMGNISQLSDPMLERVRAKDTDFIGEQLTDLKMKVKGIDISAFTKKKNFLARIPLLGALFDKVERSIAKFDTLNRQLEVISNHLEDGMERLLRDVETLEQLYLRNKDSYNELTLYIMAGRKKLELVKKNDLPKAQEHAAQSGNPMAAQAVRDLMERIQRFERRLHDMELSRVTAIQTAPQIRVVQNNNQLLAEKIQTSILTTVPIWKNQMVLALAMRTQQNASKLQKELTDTTNNLLRKNAEVLQMSTIETAREIERSSIDVDTLREVQNRLLNTIDETVNIANEARNRRISVERELVSMEQELHKRLTAVTTRKVI